MKLALPPIIDQESRTLILGTMPGERSIALQQYYANKGNSFWRLLFEVFDEPFSEDYQVRKSLLSRHGIALWNTLAECERQGSADHRIKNERANDFAAFFSRWPNIKAVFFESKAAAKFYEKYAVEMPGIRYHTLPSSSGLNARLSYAEKLAAWKQLRNIQ